MKRALASALTLLAITLAAGDGAAQEAQDVPAASAPAPAAAGLVRVHLRGYKSTAVARVYSHRPDDSWAMVCRTPCTVDAAPGTELRITLGSYEDEPHSFIVPSDAGPEVDVEVKPASVGPLVGGIVMMGGGGAFVLTGLLFLALADLGSSRNNDSVETTGFVLVGLGGASAAGGLVWLLSRSHEPRTYDRPTRRPSWGRSETLLGDVAASRPRDPTTSVPAPFTPLRFGFTF
jgi:hypothetical protein